MARLAAYVHVTDDKGEPFVFGPDDKIPGWAEKAITNPKAWADAPAKPTRAAKSATQAGDNPPAKSDKA